MDYVESSKNYKAYVDEHISNVKRAYNEYGQRLEEAFSLDSNNFRMQVRMHDVSKYSENEYDGYRQWFNTASNEEKNKTLFDYAWNHHQKINPHHPEYWIMIDDMTPKILDMPKEYIAEMLLDWQAMRYKFGGTTYDYYMSNRDRKPLSDNTRALIDSVINIFK